MIMTIANPLKRFSRDLWARTEKDQHYIAPAMVMVWTVNLSEMVIVKIHLVSESYTIKY